MYGLRYSEQIDVMSKRDFAVLCVTLLKIEISHNVQQVSTQGSDGLRDAWLEGYNKRAEMEGKWNFQFKQYTSDLSLARRRMLNDFFTETKNTFQYYSDLTGYIFITNVPYSGPRQTGSFDKVNSIISEMKHDKKLIQFWDGQEICNLIDLHYAKISPLLFPNKDMRIMLPSPNNLIFPWKDNKLTQKIGEMDAVHYVDSLIGVTGEILLSPQNNGIMAQLYFQGKFYDMIQLGMECRDMLSPYQERQKFRFLSLTLLIALAYARMGKIGMSKSFLNAFNDLKCDNGLLWGYYYDIQSLLAEKKNNYSLVSDCAEKGWKLYKEYGIDFNLTEWKLRHIHKKDWNICESQERSVEVDKFRDILRHQGKDMNLTFKEGEYIKSMKAVYNALHYTWDEDYLEDAEKEIEVGINYFKKVNCLPELARLSSEKGRIKLKAVYGSKDSILYLKEGLYYRISTGEMGRVRYDLVWLGQAYLQIQNEYYAILVSLVSRYIHFNILRFDSTTDVGLLKKIEYILQRNGLKEFINYIKKNESLFIDLECATGINNAFWVNLVDVNLVLVEMEGIDCTKL